jgi:hypothetical protein
MLCKHIEQRVERRWVVKVRWACRSLCCDVISVSIITLLQDVHPIKQRLIPGNRGKHLSATGGHTGDVSSIGRASSVNSMQMNSTTLLRGTCQDHRDNGCTVATARSTVAQQALTDPTRHSWSKLIKPLDESQASCHSSKARVDRPVHTMGIAYRAQLTKHACIVWLTCWPCLACSPLIITEPKKHLCTCITDWVAISVGPITWHHEGVTPRR